MNQSLLDRGLDALGLAGSGELARRLERYIAAIETWNPAYGLVGASGEELVIKHILDSLAPLAVLDGLSVRALADRPPALSGQTGELSLVDLGTGAGLPGIPLALARPTWGVRLVDRMTRRINFLKEMQTTLPLDNVEIVEEQVERYKGSHDIVTFRAFRPFERKLFRKVFAACAPGGFVAAYKGKADR
ncbi:MAG: 16S rRNA (guanine(527)-N(7))-methyltransferase RsmG, partial [Spirochaetales bacterium]